jgi:hypothetical protein
MMPALYRHEALIPASIRSAVANIGILRTQAIARRRPLSNEEAIAAMHVAVELSRVVDRHFLRRRAPKP